MQQAGFEAFTLNHNVFIDETVFRPIPTIVPIYDAVYNARLSSQKRLELAAQIKRLALVCFRDTSEHTMPQFLAEHARLLALMPGATFVNALTPQGFKWMSFQQVNALLAQSRVGLCLSPIEGAMRASMEYLFAGLSVVSTPSLGGRDYYFDDEYCIVADPDPRAVREAVEQLIARDVPRDHVRARTLARVEADRARYIAFVQARIDQAGGRENFADRFWKLIRGPSVMHWQAMTDFSKTVLAAIPQ
jgi:glycosyltransferase involved in cell wall biosynthesis